MIALLIALQVTNPTVSGEAWAALPTPARCYVELSINLSDPTLASDPTVRAQMREQAQDIAGLAHESYLAIGRIASLREADRRENYDLVANGLMRRAEADEVDGHWASALQGRRYLLRKIVGSYPGCGFLRPVAHMPGYAQVVAEAMEATEPPTDEVVSDRR